MDKREEATIALIVPVYNVEKYLTQCLDSVVKQSIPFDEVLLINDGSTDNSLKICQNYVSTYGYFKLISQENRGLSAARNTGMKYASGDYIMFLDSDDQLALDAVKILKEQIHQAPYDAVLFDAGIDREKQIPMVNRNIYDRSHAGLDGIEMSGWNYFIRSYPRNYVVSACMAIYRKSMLTEAKIYFPEGLYYEDNYFTFQFLAHAEKMIHISEKLYQRRFRADSITTGKYSEKKFADYMKVVRLIWEQIAIDTYAEDPLLKKELLALISDHFMIILENHHTCMEQKINLTYETNALLTSMTRSYFDILRRSGISIMDLDLSMVSRLFSIFHELSDQNITDRNVMTPWIDKTIEIQKKYYIQLLQELPFDKKDHTVGIYGTGKHTEGLLEIYEKLVGKIACKLLFIDSRKSDQIYLNRKLINYQMVKNQNLDLIIISSFVHEQEMIDNLKSIHSAIPVYTFYQELNGEIFSSYKTFLEYC